MNKLNHKVIKNALFNDMEKYPMNTKYVESFDDTV